MRLIEIDVARKNIALKKAQKMPLASQSAELFTLGNKYLV